ncbi:metallophosphoesterase [Tepidibacillus marianensis]|uniref:metallophosphoesterase n=1 Tax=Tepidibacillus marianensis TaxID=3131995 RepID=UPI0030D25ACD
MIWALATALALGLLYYRAHRNTYKPDFKHIELKINEKWTREPIQILHLSDLHMENISITPTQLYEQLVKKEIDIIALTGDYLDKAKNIEKFLDYLHVLHKLKPKHGIYVVFGNHDYLLKKQIPYFRKRIEETGTIVLVNENKTISIDGQIINVIGIDDSYSNHHDILKAYKGIAENGINLVLSHDPHIVLEMDGYPFDYLLSGHFHGGQINYPKPYHLAKMGKFASQNIIKGLHFHKEMPFYISAGLGQTGLNIRLLSRPEITLHTLVN